MQVITSKTNSPKLHPELLQKNYFLEISNIQSQKPSVSLQPYSNFRGEMSLGNEKWSDQRFSIQQKESSIVFQNYPPEYFPNIKIVLERKNSKIKIKGFEIERSDNSVKGELLYTRIFLMLSEIGKFSLDFKNEKLPPLDFSFNKLFPEVKKYMLSRAKVARKLRFLELFFKTTFNLPEKFDGNDIRQMEVLFRGITEGKFSIPNDDSVTIFNYKLSDEDVKNTCKPLKKQFKFSFNEDLLVLGKFISTGEMSFLAEKAAIANPNILRNYVKDEIIPSLRLTVYDYQIQYRFEKYIDSQRLLKNKQKLERFKNDLRKEEPEFLVKLLDDPLSVEIPSKIAIEIVEGLLQYYDFPDRFSVLKPELENNQWRVPIALTYPKHEPIKLEDAFVDVKTGQVKMKISFDKLLKKGKKKAKEAFSIA